MKLLQISGLKNGASVFLSSGSEAVDLSIRLSRHITGRKRILKIDTSYLSAYGFGRALDENENNVVSIPFDKIGTINDMDFIENAVFE